MAEPLFLPLDEVLAAYLFHLAQNRPFVDGNRGTVLAAALAFIWLNDRRLVAGVRHR